jgi:hypothetical protein
LRIGNCILWDKRHALNAMPDSAHPRADHAGSWIEQWHDVLPGNVVQPCNVFVSVLKKIYRFYRLLFIGHK